MSFLINDSYHLTKVWTELPLSQSYYLLSKTDYCALYKFRVYNV